MYKVSDNDFKRGDTMMVSCTTTVCYTTVLVQYNLLQTTHKQTHREKPKVSSLRFFNSDKHTNIQTHK